MDRLKNYMFFENLEQLSRDIDKLMSLDKDKVDAIITNGHDWAAEHVTTAKDDIEEVTNFLLSNADKELNDKPYDEQIDENGIVRRTFYENTDTNELEWHRDKEDRVILPINENDWMIQFDNDLPVRLNVNEEFFIPKETFHRVIKGSTDLVVEVIKTTFEEDEYELFEAYETYEVIEEGKKKKKKKKKKKTKKDACYYKVKGRYKVWPSAYASGALTTCRNVGAANWGNSTDESELDEAKKRKLTAKPSSETNLGDWFKRKGAKGKTGGWVDCNTCRKDSKTGRNKCKPCGREEGEKRAKYPACRPTPAACKTKGKGKKWGKKSKKNENLQESDKNTIFVENLDMKDIILHNLHETTQPEVKPDVKPTVVPQKNPSPLRRRLWESKPASKPKPKMEEGKIVNVKKLNDGEAILDVIIDGKLVKNLSFENSGEVVVEPMAYDEEWVYNYVAEYNNKEYGVGVGFFGHPDYNLELSDIDDNVEEM